MISGVYGSEENPMVCKSPICIAEDESQGIMDFFKPKVVSMFHDDEAIVWLNIEQCGEVDTKEFDWLTLCDAQTIWRELNKR